MKVFIPAKYKVYIRKIKEQKKWQVSSLVILICLLGLTVFAVQKVQELRSNAKVVNLSDAFLFTDAAGNPLVSEGKDTYVTESLEVSVKIKDLNSLIGGEGIQSDDACPEGYMCKGFGDGKLSDEEVVNALSCTNAQNEKAVYECGKGESKKYRMCWNDYTQTKSGNKCFYAPSSEGQLYECGEYDDIAEVSDTACQKVLQVREEFNYWETDIMRAPISMKYALQEVVEPICGASMVLKAIPLACSNGQLIYHQYIKGALTGCLWKSGNLSDFTASLDASQTVKPDICGTRTTPGSGRIPNSYDFSRFQEDIGSEWLVWMAGLFQRGIFPGIDFEEKELVYYSRDAFENTYCTEDPSNCPTKYVDYYFSDWDQKAQEDYAFFDRARLLTQDYCLDTKALLDKLPGVITKNELTEDEIADMTRRNPGCSKVTYPSDDQLYGILLMTALSQHYASPGASLIRSVTDNELFDFLFSSKAITDWLSGYELTTDEDRVNAVLGILGSMPQFKAGSFSKFLKLKPASDAVQTGWELKNAVGASKNEGVGKNFLATLGKRVKEVKTFTSVYRGVSPNLAYKRLSQIVNSNDFGKRTQLIQSKWGDKQYPVNPELNEVQNESWALAQLSFMLDSVKNNFIKYSSEANAKGLTNIPEAIDAFKAHALFIGRPEFEQVTQQMANRMYDLTNAGYTVIVYLKDDPIGASDGFIATEVLQKYSRLQYGKPELAGKLVVATNADKAAAYANSIGYGNVKIIVMDDVVASGDQMGSALTGVSPLYNPGASKSQTNGGLIGNLISNGGFTPETARDTIEINVMAIPQEHLLKTDAWGLKINSYFNVDRYELPTDDAGFKGTSVASFYSSTDFGWESTLMTINNAYKILFEIDQIPPLLTYIKRPYKTGGLLDEYIVTQWNTVRNYFPMLE